MIFTGTGTANSAPVRIRYVSYILITSFKKIITIFMISTGTSTAKAAPVRIRYVS